MNLKLYCFLFITIFISCRKNNSSVENSIIVKEDWSKIISKTSYNENGEQLDKFNYKYDSLKRLIEIEYFDKNNQITYKNRDFYYVDKECNYHEDYYYKGNLTNTFKYKVIFYNNELTKILTKSMFDKNNKKLKESVYVYDSYGRFIERKNYNNLSNLVYKYNDFVYKGNIVTHKEESYSKENILLTQRYKTIFYDKELTKILEYYIYNSSDEQIYEDIYTYDNQGRIVGRKIITKNSGLITEYRDFSYNSDLKECIYFIDYYSGAYISNTIKYVEKYLEIL